MASLWPWLAVAGAGALHGLNPATGWMFAAAWGVRARDGAHARRALLPIAVGHVTSMTLVAGAFALGLSMDRVAIQVVAGGLLAIVAILHFSPHAVKVAKAPAANAGLALFSFIMSTAHGTGLMLVPALMPLCLGGAPAPQVTSSGSLAMIFVTVGVHTAAMIAAAGLIAIGACRGFGAGAGWIRRQWCRLPH